MSARRRRLLPRGGAGVGVVLLVAVTVMATAGQVSAAPAVQRSASPHLMADGGAGTGGSFVPLSQRLADTHAGTGGYSTPMVTIQ